ncbi:MAG: FixH family protein [Magnetospirillum sp.]|nr:FixH family protein [Magnetospirillum sp.]
MKTMDKAAAALFAIAVLAGLSTSAWADPKDYVFVPVNDHLQPSSTAPIAVRLIHAPTKKPVPGAIIIQSRLEMPMPGTAPMVAKITPKGADGAGVYSFAADLAIQGQWILNLAAKVQGEGGTVTGSVPLTVSSGAHSGN